MALTDGIGLVVGDIRDKFNDLSTLIGGKANATHTHAISDVTGLQTALDGKQDAITFGNGLSYNSGTGDLSAVPFWGDIQGTLTDQVDLAGVLSGKMDYNATLGAFAGLTWTAGTQVPVLTAANTFSLKTVGSAAGNILDKAAGDALYRSLSAPYAWGTITGQIGNQADLISLFDELVWLSGGTFAGKVTTKATATGGAGLNLPHGTAPSSPVNGDIWSTSAGLYVRVNGTTVGPLSSTTSAITPTSVAATGTVTGTNIVQGFGTGFSGKPTASQKIPAVAPYAFTATTNSVAKAGTAATASTVITVKKGATTVLTYTFAAGATLATTSVSAGSISAGDLITIEAPATPDATLADIAFLVRA